jgi:hypothetical protein
MRAPSEWGGRPTPRASATPVPRISRYFFLRGTFLPFFRAFDKPDGNCLFHFTATAALSLAALARDHVQTGRTIAQRAVAIEARTNLLFSFEKMALRDALKSDAGAKAFAAGLWDLLHGDAPMPERFDRWAAVLAHLPRRQTRVLTWPLATVFSFIAQPRLHFFLKPMVTRRAARNYGYNLAYQAKPDWATYSGVLAFAQTVRADIRDLRPRDMIDLQSYIWVQGSDEYPE